MCPPPMCPRLSCLKYFSKFPPNLPTNAPLKVFSASLSPPPRKAGQLSPSQNSCREILSFLAYNPCYKIRNLTMFFSRPLSPCQVVLHLSHTLREFPPFLFLWFMVLHFGLWFYTFVVFGRAFYIYKSLWLL